MTEEPQTPINNTNSFDIDELEQMVEEEILETNKTLQEYNSTIQKALLLIDEFYNQIKKTDK